MKRRSIPFVLIGLVGFWLLGFVPFTAQIASMRESSGGKDMPPTDAIVVLTGGSDRVSTGVELLALGGGKKLFISGVHKKLPIESVLRPLTVPLDLQGCCIVLGYQAGSTAGNASETRDWIKSEGYTSLRLVTANYHMPRSLLLFHAAMPEVTIIPYPVAPGNVKVAEWWKHPGTINLLATEYSKYLVARLMLWMNVK
jgi:uncharacterized SAM-binding protein YcdF (DUF218 family)